MFLLDDKELDLNFFFRSNNELQIVIMCRIYVVLRNYFAKKVRNNVWTFSLQWNYLDQYDKNYFIFLIEVAKG